MEFSRQEYWSGLPFPSLGDLPDPGMEPRSPALQADSLPSEPPGKLWSSLWSWLQSHKHYKVNSLLNFCLHTWTSSSESFWWGASGSPPDGGGGTCCLTKLALPGCQGPSTLFCLPPVAAHLLSVGGRHRQTQALSAWAARPLLQSQALPGWHWLVTTEWRLNQVNAGSLPTTHWLYSASPLLMIQPKWAFSFFLLLSNCCRLSDLPFWDVMEITLPYHQRTWLGVQILPPTYCVQHLTSCALFQIDILAPNIGLALWFLSHEFIEVESRKCLNETQGSVLKS